MPVNTQPSLRLVCSIDVEEEGLFGQEYHCQQRPVHNVPHLQRLLPLIRDEGLAFTLFCAHAVFSDVESCRTIARLRDQHGLEVGAHLHHWNTPPLVSGLSPVLHGSAAVNTALLPVDCLRDKLHSLFAAGREFQGAALTSFRMGRWDLRREHWSLLAEVGVTADASVRPLHCGRLRAMAAGEVSGALGAAQAVPTGPPDHFTAPCEPYRVCVNGHSIVELPLTTSPLLAGLPRLVEWLDPPLSMLPWQGMLRASLQKWGALTLLPVYQPLWLLKLCTLAHVQAGGRTLSLTWHSSEMMPKGAPHMPNEQAVQAFMRKVQAYVQWLRRRWAVEPLTLNQLCRQCASDRMATVPPAAHRADWTYA